MLPSRNTYRRKVLEKEGEKWSKKYEGSYLHGSVVKNPNRIHEDTGLNLGFARWVGDPALL